MSDMKIINYKDVKSIEMLPGIFRHTLISTKDIMMVYFDLRKGAELPMHSHPHTQIGFIIKGILEFYIYGKKYILNPGDSYLAPSNVEHGAKIIEDCIVIDVFNPAREDYK